MALSLFSCADSTNTNDEVNTAYEADPVIAAPPEQSDEFAVGIFNYLANNETGNFIFSPAAAESALRMLSEGAAGVTLDELSALPMGEPDTPSALQISTASRLFADENVALKPTAKNVERVPFSDAPDKAGKAINAWSHELTDGKIHKAVNPGELNSDLRLLAVSAAHLHALWLRPFSKADTDKRPFYLENGKQINVDMMFLKEQVLYAEGADWEAVALFYRRDTRKGEPGCFVAILPKGDARDFAAKLTAAKLTTIRAALAVAKPEKVLLDLPRFEFNTRATSLKSALISLGVLRLFSAANLSAMAGEPLSLDDLVQSCSIKVDEQDAQADASRDAIVPGESAAHITFDRPFLWYVGDISSEAAPFFMGMVFHP